MTETGKEGSRDRLLEAAASLIAASPGKDVPLRAICDRAGVRLPTLYHFFGSKEGLLDAVIDHGFDLYVGVKESQERSDDPIADLREGWDAHVRFGLENPGFYALMYGQVAPGHRPQAQERPARILRRTTAAAAEAGLLSVDPDRAADHVLAANIGVTLTQIVGGAADPDLSTAVREATIAAITGATAARGDATADPSRALLQSLVADPGPLAPEELALLRRWLRQLADAGTEE